jgi:hypothetical protein
MSEICYNNAVETKTNTEAAEPKLKFAEIYDSPEWKELGPIDRAQLMLVAEGVKPGTIIGGNLSTFQNIVQKMGLKTHLNTEPNELWPVYEVASPAVMDERYHDLLALPKESTSDDYHKINGKFLGYPVCCTEEYNNPQKNLAARMKFSPHKFISNVDFELTQMIEKGETYPEELDFCPPAFTPCSATCPEALRVLKQWKDIILLGDKDAAEELQMFNWRGSPVEKIHAAKLDERSDKRYRQYQSDMLRSQIWKTLE